MMAGGGSRRRLLGQLNAGEPLLAMQFARSLFKSRVNVCKNFSYVCKRERGSVAPPKARSDTWRCGRFTLMHSLAQKHNILPFNGTILTVQTPASLFIVVREATIAGGGL
jgi:hypothetical protein